MRVVTVLKSGPEYQPKHVIWLAAQIIQHNPDAHIVCLSDHKFSHPDIEVIPLANPWVKWWSKMNIYSTVLDGDVFYMDIDTCVVGPLDEMVNLPRSTALCDFYRPNMIQSGILYVKEEDKGPIYSEFARDPIRHMSRCVTRDRWGDGGYLEKFAHRFDRWQHVLPGAVVSYKVHSRSNGGKLPAGASVVCFHGNPRPWQSKASWVPPL